MSDYGMHTGQGHDEYQRESTALFAFMAVAMGQRLPTGGGRFTLVFVVALAIMHAVIGHDA